MKTRLLLVGLILLAIAGTWRVTHAQTADPLTTALTNDGMDPTQAGAWAASVELTLTAEKAFVTSTNNSIAALQNSVASLITQLGTVNLQIALRTRPAAIGYTVPIPAVTMLGASALPNIGAFPEGITLGGAGSFYDYGVNLPASGQYAISASLNSSAVGTLVFHVEDPVGSAGPSVAYAGTAGFTNVSGPALTLGPGPQVIRFVVNSTTGNTFHMNWLYLTKLS